jgi:hypothetical protein
MDYYLNSGYYYWARWEDTYPVSQGNNVIVGGNLNIFDPIQGGIGDCYVVSSAAALAERTDVKSSILTQTSNNAGIYAFRFYIRGIPWVVSIDSNLLTKQNSEHTLTFAEKNV